MEYKELSPINVKEISEELYKKIIKEYNYDLVIFIAKGSLNIGIELANLNKVPLLEIKATRQGGKLKKFFKPLMKIVPKNILIKLREKEMKSKYHEKNDDRQVIYNNNVFERYKERRKILLVDDSIDSGCSIIKVKEELERTFTSAELKVAVFNVMKKSIIRPDFYMYEDNLISGPWSNDSRYNNEFVKQYKEWKEEYERKG